MGFCVDRSTRYLKDLGYNVVRHPAEGLAPLDVIGRLHGQPYLVGTVLDLLDGPQAPVPPIEADLAAANINGKTTSKLPLELGLDILGAILTGLGGNVGVKAKYEDAKMLQFRYENVTKDRVTLAPLGSYLESGEIRWSSMGVREFLEPGGELFVVVETVESDTFGLSAFRKRDVAVEVSLPEIQDVLRGGGMNVRASAERQTELTYAGAKRLVFGFICVELAIADDENDELRLTFKPSKPGEVFLRIGDTPKAEPAMLSEGGVLPGLPQRRT